MLHWAAYWGTPEVVHVLLEHGADPNIKDESGSTALRWALWAEREDNAEVLERLGAEP